MKKIFFILAGIFFNFCVFPASSARERLESWQIHTRMRDRSIFKALHWINIGPLHIGGRITDIEAYENYPAMFFVGAASGGVWFTRDNGKNWQSIFENESSISIGDIAISQKDKNLIWVGTGEANSSRNDFAGTGIFKSTDSGKTWRNMGLDDTHHIGRVIVDPVDNNTVYVAALGHLYTYNEQRGIFKTTDGGKTWKKILFISSKTGFIDMVMHPRNNKTLFAASWEKHRKAWNFIESGEESCIFKTTDAGQNWVRLTNNFPRSQHTGRIGLSISRSNPDVIYGLLDNQEPRSDKTRSGISIEMIAKMNIQDFLRMDTEKLDLFLKENRAPRVYDGKMVKEFVKSGKILPKDIARFFSDAQERRLNPYVKGAEVYRSDDEGSSWQKMNTDYLESMYLTYGFYFGQIRISPENENIVYILGIPLLKSLDGGKTFSKISDEMKDLGDEIVHRDSHALWINPNNPRHLLLGTDGGLNISYNGGARWEKMTNFPLSQCYTIQYDFQRPFHIYCGLQDNGIVVGSSEYRYGDRDTKWEMIWGGDGAFVDIDRENPYLVFLESQFGMIQRLDFKNKIRKNIQPQPGKTEIPYRFNWLSPFMVSKQYPSTLYMGANHVLKSSDRGDSWSEISPDLSNKKKILGNEPFATITSIDESIFNHEILYAGTDDGNLWVTRDRGGHWDKINDILPNKWVTRVVESIYHQDQIYVTLSGYREDDFRTYIYTTQNYGQDWESLKGNLPEEPVNVIREDPEDRDMLYIGTDLGVYVTFDRGEFWYSLKNNLPTIPVYDLRIHPRDKMLMIATHGRGVYLLSTEKIKRWKKDQASNG